MAGEFRSLVTGANRGLGLEFVRQLLARGDRVIAGCRQPGAATALNRLAGEYPGHLHVLPLDLQNERSRQAFVGETERLHDGLDLLVNNAGMLHPGERFGALQADVLAATLATNTIGPWLLAQALAPLLARGARPRIANISSEMGSIAGTRELRAPSYAISKAALNMASVLLARALNPQGIGVLTFNPGWVRTDMGGSGATLTAAESVRDLLDLVARVPGIPAGEFLDHDGRALAW